MTRREAALVWLLAVLCSVVYDHPFASQLPQLALGIARRPAAARRRGA